MNLRNFSTALTVIGIVCTVAGSVTAAILTRQQTFSDEELDIMLETLGKEG